MKEKILIAGLAMSMVWGGASYAPVMAADIPAVQQHEAQEQRTGQYPQWGVSYQKPNGYVEMDDSTAKNLALLYRKQNNLLSVDILKDKMLQGSEAMHLYDLMQQGLKSQIKEKGYGNATMKVMTIQGKPWLHISYEIPDTVTVVKDEYDFIGYGKLYSFTFYTPKDIYEQEKQDFTSFMDSVEVKDSWRTVTIANTDYSFKVPDSFVDMTTEQVQDISSEHTYLAGDLRFMTGVIVQPLEKYPFLPKSLADVTPEQKQTLEQGLVAHAQADSSTMQSVSFTYTRINGKPCVVWNATDQGSHNRSYIFVQDGKYISFDYGYDEDAADTAIPLVEQSAQTITL